MDDRGWWSHPAMRERLAASASSAVQAEDGEEGRLEGRVDRRSAGTRIAEFKDTLADRTY
jgi:hypothetical protein